ncbi:STAS domain-containing protein [Extensimonas vulgaris]|jgi:phospholipid transport system transporter-binding protein|uniref:STAS domain-containing protein n=1 Tax=Extensimonas vulgaris TaxID=1031594 RepID=UPI000DF14182|nr:STAS domain-containing protein [Extensimonas vulgaris]TXD13237.1 STAS domain-containing protein [Extensimonas vulgaris]
MKPPPRAEEAQAAGATPSLALPATLTHREASACLRALEQKLDQVAAPQIVVDASALAAFDTSALAVLLECRREALARGKSFAVKNLPAALGGMSKLYGVDVLLPAA